MEDWKELEKKGEGRKYLVGDLEGYVKDKIANNDYSQSKEDYVVECPYCAKEGYLVDTSYDGKPYLKRKLYVTKDFQLGHCFRCDHIYLNMSEKLPATYAFHEFNINSSEFELCRLDGKTWNLDLFKLFSEEDEKGFEYLVTKRHKFMAQLASVLKIRYFDSNPVIPFFYRDEFIYYQIKYIHNSRLPYFTPPIEYKPAYIIEHGDNHKFVICEGVFDAIANLILYPDRTPFAILGSSITDYQISMLRTYVPHDIIVYMDETSISKKVAEKVNHYIGYANISIIRSTGQDPEEHLKELIAEGIY